MLMPTPSTRRRARHGLAHRVFAPLCAALFALAACGDDDDAPFPVMDAGTVDLGTDGHVAEDGGEADAGIPDTDAGTRDAGTPDTDAGTPDTDAGMRDAGPTMCTMRPRTGCCFADSDCTGPRERCVGSVCDPSGEGVCKADPPGADACWDDKDCRAGTTCMSANICPCGAACFVADMPGVCVPTL